MRRRLLLTLLSLLLCWPLWAQVDFRKETIYFLITTRFYDGDPSNNRPNEWCSYIPGVTNPNITDPNDVTWRGDFKGLMQKLDYIKDLGFTAIWITPIVQNRGPLDYHGYHAWDFTKVDPRYESPGATFKDLVDAAHAKGIKIILDIVTNHSGRFGVKGKAELKYNTDPTQPWGKDSQGKVLQDNPSWQYDGLTPNPADGKIWSRANLAKMPAPYNQNLAAYNWPSTESFVNTSDPTWFHQSGNGFVQGWDDTTNCYQRAIAGDCPDINTGSKVVQDYFFNAYKQYLDAGVDAIRWDTFKHMNKEDIIALVDRFKAYKPDLFIFGEVAQKRHELHQVQELNPHWYTWRGAVGNSAASGASVIDFYGQATFHGVFQDGGGFSGVKDAARYDHLYNDASYLVTWLDNHDFGPNNNWDQRYSGSDENLAACMNFMFTWRGIPSVYYGTEMRFKAGAYTDIHDAAGINRSINETGRAYYGDVMDQAPNHRIYKHIRKLNAMRKAIPALQNGTWQWAGNAPGNGVGFTRQSGSSFVCVGLAKDGSASFSFTGVPNATYRDAVTGRTIAVSNGTLAFTVQSGSAGVFVKDGPGMIGENGAGFFEPCVSGCDSNPVATISPAGGTYYTPQTVTLSAAGGTAPYSLYYTLDGSTPTTSSSKYTAALTISAATTLKVLAVDAQGKQSTVATASYTFTTAPADLEVYFKRPTTWASTVKVYYWSEQPAGTLTATTWPGVDMTKVCGDWYKYTFKGVSSVNLVFNDGGANKTIDLQATKTAYYDNGWLTTVPTIGGTPVASFTATPTSGTAPLSVVLDASASTACTALSYAWDLGNGQTATGVKPTATYTTAGTYTVKLTVTDAQLQTATSSTQITVTPPITTTGITLYFKRPSTWATTVKVHLWNALPAGSLTATTWPGVAMTSVCNGWYKYDLPQAVTSTSVIFNDGAGKQTADLQATKTSYYDGAWLASAPTTNGPDCTTTTASIKLHLKRPTTWTAQARVYYWNTVPAVATVAWPGAAMTDEGNGWFGYTITGAQTSSIIFNNNGSPQTADLTGVTGEVWYDNGFVSKPANWREEQITGLGDTALAVGFRLLPNPAGDFFALEATAHEGKVLGWQLFDMLGRQLAQGTGKVMAGRMPLQRPAGLPKGVYLLRISDGRPLQALRLMFE